MHSVSSSKIDVSPTLNSRQKIIPLSKRTTSILFPIRGMLYSKIIFPPISLNGIKHPWSISISLTQDSLVFLKHPVCQQRFPDVGCSGNNYNHVCLNLIIPLNTNPVASRTGEFVHIIGALFGYKLGMLVEITTHSFCEFINVPLPVQEIRNNLHLNSEPYIY